MIVGEPLHPILWVQTLVAAIAAAVVATMVDNAVKGEDTRPHNSLLLFNECLAEHHTAYLIFFIALATGSSFSRYWGTGTLTLAFILWLLFYVKGIRSITRHWEIIDTDHTCSAECTIKLDPKTIFKICGWNTIFAASLFATSIYLSCITTKNP